ncbi:MAG: hypothetical protein ABI273_12300 [Lacunisphaera sp.]
MRHIDHTALLSQIFADDAGTKVKASLERAYKTVAKKRVYRTRKKYIDDNGSSKWKPLKDRLTDLLGKKCWYTEHELIGAPLAMDHFRPVCDYWWLAFSPENYRVSCPWANSPEHNAIHGRVGGKGDNFPLLAPAVRATAPNHLANEQPVILDPCVAVDCDLLAFQADGRPVLNPNFAGNAVATQRVEESKILLNLDHPEFNSKREQLRVTTEEDVHIHEVLPPGSPERTTVLYRVAARLGPTAPFSTAARFYLSLHRHLDWVQAILDAA